MSEFVFVHRAGSSETSGQLSSNLFSENQGHQNGAIEASTPSLLFWKTCRRQILFLDNHDLKQFALQPGDQVYEGFDAEVFLAEILCGLHSLLIGETEVFGQFKIWWKNLPADLFWKRQHHQRIERLFALVKKVREEVLCGCGSQSYGSIMRRHLKPGQAVDVIGAGHLAQELAPWLVKHSYRIWCRSPHKVDFDHKASQILELGNASKLNSVVVVAAPLEHSALLEWLRQRGLENVEALFDLRADSEHFKIPLKLNKHLNLSDFTTQKESFQQDMEEILSQSRSMIFQWKEQQQSKNIIRPFGWDDL